MWTCPKCQEEVDDEMEVCWSCGTSADGVEDPHFFDEPEASRRSPGERYEDLALVAQYLVGAEAYAMRTRLEEEGIPAVISDEFTTTMGLLSSSASGGAKVLVPREHLERAREILGIVVEEETPEPEEGMDDEEMEQEEDAGDDEQADDTPDEGIQEPQL